MPHAHAEETVLYPAVERAMGATSTMVADHHEIVRRTDALAATIASTGRASAADLRRQLYGLRAILDLHFDKEEDVLLPVLDAELTAEQADRLFAEMAASAHG